MDDLFVIRVKYDQTTQSPCFISRPLLSLSLLPDTSKARTIPSNKLKMDTDSLRELQTSPPWRDEGSVKGGGGFLPVCRRDGNGAADGPAGLVF